MRNFTSGDLGILLVVIQLRVTRLKKKIERIGSTILAGIGAILGNGCAIQGEKICCITLGEWNHNRVSPQELHFMFIML